MTRRYFCPELPATGGPVSLSSEEASHAIRVMRVQIGDSVHLFDGLGQEAAATITSVNRKSCVCIAEERVAITRMPELQVELGIAFPKPDRTKEMIERLTEIGVASITPLVASRTQRPPSPGLIEKLQRVVIEACKQSERNTLLEIKPIQSAESFFGNSSDASDSGSSVRLIAHQSDQGLNQIAMPSRTKLVAAIGPEGGWTKQEIAVAKSAGFQCVDLGKRIYRTETAAVVVGSWATNQEN